MNLSQLGGAFPRRDPAGPAHDEGDFHPGVIKEGSLDQQLLVPQHVTMVAGHDHQGVVGQTGIFQSLQDPTHLEIEQGDGGEVA